MRNSRLLSKLKYLWISSAKPVKLVSAGIGIFVFVILSKSFFPVHDYTSGRIEKETSEEFFTRSETTEKDLHRGDLDEKKEYAQTAEKKLYFSANSPAVGYSPDSAGIESSIAQKIIKTASISIEVGNYPESAKEIEKIAKETKGFVQNSSSYSDNKERKSGSIILKVPADKFEDSLSKIEKIGKVLSKSLRGQDVTEEYIDIEARLKNAEKTEKRILTFLEKAKNAKEAVEVQKELNNITDTIERYKGKLKYLNNAVGYSSITVNIGEPSSISVVPGQTGFGRYIKNIFQDVARSSVSTFASVIKAIIVIISFLIPIALLMLIVLLIYTGINKKRKSA